MPSLTARPDLSKIRAPRVITVALVAAVLVLVALTVSGRARSELVASVQREPEPFLELSFPDPAQARECQVEAGKLRLRFAVRSHLDAPASLPYRVQVDERAGRADTGSLAVEPGATRTGVAEVAVPRRGEYRVRVTLPGRPEHLSLVCPPKADS